MDAQDYFQESLALLPTGEAWQVNEDTTEGMLLLAFSDMLARVDAQMRSLMEQADPRSADKMLADWETTAALPDTCTGAPDSISERQAALWQKVTSIGGQNAAYFKDVAAQLGYIIQIVEPDAFTTESDCDQEINGDDWKFVWQVNVLPSDNDTDTSAFTFFAEFTTESTVDDYIDGWGALNIECVFNRLKPAHTTVLFAYPPAPVPTLFFDFTTGL